MATDAGPIVSITVVVYNSATHLRDCLSAIRPSLSRSFAELIVVDNASPDDSPDIVTRDSPDAVLIRSASNRGFAAGCNLAWPRARGRYWLLLNPDVVVPPNGIEELVRWLERRPHLGAASPQLIGLSGDLHATGRRFPSAWRTTLEMSGAHRFSHRGRRDGTLLGGYWVRAGQDFEADWVPGAALIVRRDAVAAAGLMSERFFMYGEDVEWCWRIRRAGWAIGVAGAIRFRHAPGGSAIRTWGPLRWHECMWRGWYHACWTTRGSVHAALLLGLQTVALAMEVVQAPRGSLRRRAARRDLGIHIGLVRQSVLDACRRVGASAWRRCPGIGKSLKRASTDYRIPRLR